MNKKQQQVLIGIVIATIGLIYVWQSYLVGPLNKQYKDKTQELTKIKSEIETLKQQSFELPRIKKQVEYLKLEVEELEKYLPTEKELPGLLRSITKTASTYQLKVTNITPAGSSQKQRYTEYVFDITMQGNYHTLAKFLADIGQSGRIISARNINFTPMVSAGQTEITTSVNFQLVAYTYNKG